ncbi:MAG TPA: alpha/beta hydrolase [Gemmatimonadales bacterium]|nr:alpha/beta hydrolase [Gemmatimonadales bacterium]
MNGLIPIRDVSLYVKVMGHGSPLLLMHGGPGLDHTTLSSLEPLADQFTLIFYDHRCNGRSTGIVESMTWENLTADADALRQTLGFDQWAVLGHSFGGNVALEYALRYPQRLSRLLLLDTCGDAWWAQHNAPDILAKRGYRAATVAAARRFYNGAVTPDEVRPIVFKFIGAYFYRFGLRSLPHALRSGFRIKMRPEVHPFAFKQLLTGWTVMDRLHEIEAPALVLAGRHDFLFPPEHQAILADRLPHAQLEIVERAGHNAHEEQAALVRGMVSRFLATAHRGAALATSTS